MPLTFQLSPKEAVYMRGIEFEVMARNPFSRSLWKIYQWQMSNKEHLLRLHASHTSAIRATPFVPTAYAGTKNPKV